MPKERNKTDGYREKAYEGDTKAMNRSTSKTITTPWPMLKPVPL